MDDIRSFIAIEIPPPLKARMEEIQRELRGTDADVKWVRPEAIHLTLKFLGPIRQEDVERISRALAPIVSGGESFEVRVKGLGCFPHPRSPRVVWLGVDRGREALARLQGGIERKTAELSFPPEDRPFSPHLTLGRVRSPRGRTGLAQALERHRDAEIGSFQAREVILFRSELRPSGAVYTKLSEFPMGRASGSDD
jgi:2'-5' RNA ligase